MRSHKRSLNHRLWVVLLIFFALPIFGLTVGMITIKTFFSPSRRLTVFFPTEPAYVYSYEPKLKQAIIVSFPKDAYFSGIYGYGEYALDSLWQLAKTQQASPSSVILASLTDELGTPVEYYITRKGKLWDAHPAGDEKIYDSFFTYRGLAFYLLGQYETNIPLSQFFRFMASRNLANLGKVSEIELAEGNGLMKKTAGDGTVYLRFDREQFDILTDIYFQDVGISNEQLRIAVYNTTDQPFLGSRIGRILTRIGGNVVFVGNDNTTRDRCEVDAKKELLGSQTVTRIEELFSCHPKELIQEGPFDVLVYVGKAYERQFLPMGE